MMGLLRLEWRILAADRSLGLLLALLGLSVGYGLRSGVAWASQQDRSVQMVTESAEKEIGALREQVARFESSYPDAGPGWDPADPRQKGVKGLSAGTLAIAGYRAGLRPGPLAALSVGQGDLHPPHTKVSLWNNRHDLFSEAENENPLHLLHGRFDLAFVVVYLYPLFILAMSYNLISAEREGGTLALVMSQPVRLPALVARRAALLLAVLLVPLLLMAGVGIALAGLPLGGGETTLRLLLWAAVVVAYGLFWFAVAVAINALGFGSATNAIALACTWLGLVLVVPSLLNLVVTTARPVPSRVEYIQTLRRAANESESSAALLRAQYYEEHPEMRPGEDGGGSRANIYDYWLQKWGTARRMEPVLDRYERALDAQIRLAALCRWASPSMLAQDAMNELAGTTSERYRSYRDQVARFQREWHAFFAPRMFLDKRMTGADYRSFPRFAPTDEPAVEALARVGLDLLGIGIPTAALLAIAGSRLRSYPAH